MKSMARLIGSAYLLVAKQVVSAASRLAVDDSTTNNHDYDDVNSKSIVIATSQRLVYHHQYLPTPCNGEINFNDLSAPDPDNDDTQLLLLGYDIGNTCGYETQLYEKDCSTEIIDVDIATFDPVEIEDDNDNTQITIGYSINKHAIEDTSVWNIEEQIEVCVAFTILNEYGYPMAEEKRQVSIEWEHLSNVQGDDIQEFEEDQPLSAYVLPPTPQKIVQHLEPLNEDTLCSCSPTVFTFALRLNQTCSDNDIEDNSGIDGSFCFTEEGVAVPEPPPQDLAFLGLDGHMMPPAEEDNWWLPVWKQYLESRDDEDQLGPLDERILQSDDPVTEIVSVQFLEIDTSGDLTVINQDDTYADVTLVDGDKLKFNSASSFLDTSLPLEDQMSNPDLVPGGAILILYGKTASGVVVRNRFFWIYDMNCGEENSPINVDDEIGWVKVVRFSHDMHNMYYHSSVCVSNFEV